MLALKHLAVLVCALAAAASSSCHAAKDPKDPRRCGNRERAICCGAWGNTCIDNALSCCNDVCVPAPYNPQNPEAVCGGSSSPVCAFGDMMVRTTKFNSANGYVMTLLAKAVYPDTWALPDNDTLVGSAFAPWVQSYGITNATFLNARNRRHEVDTEGVCMRDDRGNVFVVFRGTSSMADAATDADIYGSITPERNKMFGVNGVNLHDGFTDAYYYVRDATKACVDEMMQQVADMRASALKANNTAVVNSTSRPMLWVGGHSLGAALATLAATDFAQMGYRPVVYTIGSPRVGDKDWVNLYDVELGLKNQTFRMVNENDPVARVPIEALSYRHVGTGVNLNATRGSCIVPAEDTDCEPGCVVSDHYTDPYLNASYQCVVHDKSIDLAKCPQDLLLVPTNYDLMAAEPGQGTLANESDAVLAAAANSSSAAGVGVKGSRGASLGVVVSCLAAVVAAAAAAVAG